MGKVLKFRAGAAAPMGLTATMDAVKAHVQGWRVQKEFGPGRFQQFERELNELAETMKRQAMAEAIGAADVDDAVIEVDGRRMRRAIRSSQTYMTSSGPVSVERWLYRDRTDADGRAVAAMDRRLGMMDGFWTPEAGSRALWVVTQMVPEKAAELLQRFGGMAPSKSSLDRLPKALSERWEASREEYEEALRETEAVPEDAVTVAISLDGAYAPICEDDGSDAHVQRRRDAHAQGRAARGPDAFREVGVATLSFYDGSGVLRGAKRFARAPEYKKLQVKEMLAAELESALEKNPRLQVVKMSDGAPDHWEFFTQMRIKGVEVLDFFHASEHLSAALGAAYGEGSLETRRRFEDLKFVLREDPDGVAKVQRSLAYLARKHPGKRIIERAQRYFRTHEGRMRYVDLAKRNLPIGSGVVEAACKTLVTQRAKLSGQRWTPAGVQAILTPRGWDQSDRFDRALALLAASYEAEVTIVNAMDLRSPAAG
jgi:hypothetical protein